MPRHNSKARTHTVTRAPGRYPIPELTDVGALEAWLHKASTTTRARTRRIAAS